jgi:mono/diheme cytochrome c family protein
MELVDHYLDGTMNSTDRTAFEDRLRNNKELQDLVEDQQRLRRAAQRSPARASAKKARRNYQMAKSAPWLGLGAAVLIGITAALILLDPFGPSGPREGMVMIDGVYQPVLPDTSGTGLEPFVLTIDPEKDTTVVTPNGIVLDIPQGAFVDSLGAAITTPVRVTLLEAFDPLEIMKAGLGTMSGDTLLETGGMFYLDAHANGVKVGVDPTKPLTAMVPANEAKEAMQLYEGVKRDNGVIDWRNPKPLKRSLVPVDITTLNFYPPGYEAKLAELGKDVTNKAFKDSLYFSFNTSQGPSAGRPNWTIEPSEFVTADTTYSPEAWGQRLFLKHCSACHKGDRDMTGPALKGSKLRWVGRGNIYDYVRNSVAVIGAGNQYANELFNQWNKSVMTPVDLSDVDIDAILRWADGTGGGQDGIDPAKIKTIWNARFNNSNLATKEFEERLAYIFRTCDNALLDVYVNNLDKDLYWCDSVATLMHSEPMSMFLSPAYGHVDLPKHAADRLRTFYENNSRAEAEAIRKTQEKFWNEQWKQDVKSDAKRADHMTAESVRERELFQKELAANLDTVYKQLGYKRVQMPRAAWVVPVNNLGWWNVDKAVIQATTTRSSMTYTDDQTGKTATLTYTPLTVEVADRASYDELVVYLIPNQLNSYQRMKEGTGGFSERLNSIFTYELFCLGMKGKDQFAFKTTLNGQSTVSVSLEPADENALRQMLRTRGPLETRLLDESRYLNWLVADKARTRANAARIELRQALEPIVFPCAVNATAVP